MNKVPNAALPKGGESSFDSALIKALDRHFQQINQRLNATLTSDQYGLLPSWTPTLTGVTNVTTLSAGPIVARRDADYVFVTGQCSVDPAGTGTVEFLVTLPTPSDFTGLTDAFGTVSGQAASGNVSADTVNNAAKLSFVTTSASVQIVAFSFGYILR